MITQYELLPLPPPRLRCVYLESDWRCSSVQQNSGPSEEQRAEHFYRSCCQRQIKVLQLHCTQTTGKDTQTAHRFDKLTPRRCGV